MNGSSDDLSREEGIAEIIRKYSETDVDLEWLLNPNKDPDNVFKKSFHAIYEYTGDFDLALWYLAFSQSFGGKTDPMLHKVAEMCTSADRDLITLKRDLPGKCPFYSSKDATMSAILTENFGGMDKKGIQRKINDIYKSEKFSRNGGKWCNLKSYKDCKYRADCPVSEWIELINKHSLRYRSEPKIFFYYDTLCLLNNSKIRNFDELFTRTKDLDNTRKAIVLRSILEQIRGIGTKSLLFLQMQNLYNLKDLDYSELIFVDRLALRVAERIKFPYYQNNNLLEAIKKFGDNHNLNARQIDRALWETGFICTANGCLHGLDGKCCIFHVVCSWTGKR
jgi:hypothetical protein